MTNNRPKWIKSISLTPPELNDNTADCDRLLDKLKIELKTDYVRIDLFLLKLLPQLLRKWSYHVKCLLFKDHCGWMLIDIVNPKKDITILGLAIDLGTTRVALRLLNLATGQVIAESFLDNPQIHVGPDILTRILHTDKAKGLEQLNQLIINGLNRSIEDLCRYRDLEPQNIYLISLAGNTAMTHLFMGLNPRWIIREPYIPVINKPETYKAHELGIKVNQRARVFVFPNIGSYFGGDVVAGILYSGMYKQDETSLLVDVGTNAEVVMGNSQWLIGCAGAAGPALEGGVTRMGMTAGPGVIDRVSIHKHTLDIKIHTIDNLPPKGICGSGLIDLAAQLFLTGMIDIRGRFVVSKCKERFIKKDGLDHFIVVSGESTPQGHDLSISQVDLDSLIRSKAAMYTILETITSSVGHSLKDLDCFYVAGTFGSFIKPKSAIAIGMLPDIPLDCYKPLGNSSLGGATLVLQSFEYQDEIEKIRDKITYLELNVNQEFMNRFSAAKFLPHTNNALFPSVIIK